MMERSCKNCKLNPECKRVWKNYEPTNCVCYTPIKTNADGVRNMETEALANFIHNATQEGCPPGRDWTEACVIEEDCPKCWLSWLSEEVKE